MTYTIEQIRQLNLHGPQTVMELCDEIERLQKHLESATDTKHGLGFQLYCLECKQRAEDCQCVTKQTMSTPGPCPNCEGTGLIVEPAHAKGCDGSCVNCPVPEVQQCNDCAGTGINPQLYDNV